MKPGYREQNEEEKLEKSWNNATYSTRLFTLGPVTGTITNRDEAEFASHSSWDELSPETRHNLLKHSELSQRGLKGS